MSDKADILKRLRTLETVVSMAVEITSDAIKKAEDQSPEYFYLNGRKSTLMDIHESLKTLRICLLVEVPDDD